MLALPGLLGILEGACRVERCQPKREAPGRRTEREGPPKTAGAQRTFIGSPREQAWSFRIALRVRVKVRVVWL